jgi:hypothetical protein
MSQRLYTIYNINSASQLPLSVMDFLAEGASCAVKVKGSFSGRDLLSTIYFPAARWCHRSWLYTGILRREKKINRKKEEIMSKRIIRLKRTGVLFWLNIFIQIERVSLKEFNTEETNMPYES